MDTNQTSNSGGIQANIINGPITQNNTVSYSNQILDEYEKQEAELVHKGRMEPAELHWNAVRSGQIKTIQQINDIAPATVVNAYVSEPFKYDYHGHKYLYVLVKTIENGYAKRLVRGKYYPAACAEKIWPYYLLTLNTNTGELVEIEPPQVVTLFNENKRTDTMTAIEELFLKVKEKTGHPFELRNL